MVKVRVVCKLWLKLVDKNRIFWGIVELQESSREDIEEAVNQFDEKSGSTLKEIRMVTKKEEQNEDFSQIAKLIRKSHQTLRTVHLISKEGFFTSKGKL